MVADRPKDLDEYRAWMWAEHGLEFETLQPQYDRSVDAIHRQFATSDFWTSLDSRLRSLSDAYQVRTGYLLGFSRLPDLATKGWAEFWLKTYRRNVLENGRWPKPPGGGWILPPQWFNQIGDVIRTRFVVRYLDAVILVADEIERAASESKCSARTSLQATSEGYYAAHASITRRFEIPRESFDTQRVRVRVELQVTTQVKDVVQELLHKYYEERRQVSAIGTASGWDYDSPAFRSSYLGHMAHYLEGIIMDLRGEGGPK